MIEYKPRKKTMTFTDRDATRLYEFFIKSACPGDIGLKNHKCSEGCIECWKKALK